MWCLEFIFEVYAFYDFMGCLGIIWVDMGFGCVKCFVVDLCIWVVVFGGLVVCVVRVWGFEKLLVGMADAAALAEAAGSRFELLELIGQGSFGDVYRA